MLPESRWTRHTITYYHFRLNFSVFRKGGAKKMVHAPSSRYSQPIIRQRRDSHGNCSATSLESLSKVITRQYLHGTKHWFSSRKESEHLASTVARWPRQKTGNVRWLRGRTAHSLRRNAGVWACESWGRASFLADRSASRLKNDLLLHSICRRTKKHQHSIALCEDKWPMWAGWSDTHWAAAHRPDPHPDRSRRILESR